MQRYIFYDSYQNKFFDEVTKIHFMKQAMKLEYSLKRV